MKTRHFLLLAALLCSLGIRAQRTNNPSVASTNVPEIHVDYVEFKGNKTYLHLTGKFEPNTKIWFLPLTSIVGTDKYGLDYRELVTLIKDDEGKSYSKNQKINFPTGKCSFTLECSKIPAGCTSISLDESDMENTGWQIKGIKINNPSTASSVSANWLRTASTTDVAKAFVQAVMEGDMEKATRYMHGFQSMTAAQQKQTLSAMKKDGFLGAASSAEIAKVSQLSATAQNAVVQVTISRSYIFHVSNLDYTVKLKKRTQGWSVESLEVKSRE